MKRLLLLLLLAVTLSAESQSYNNEWIDYNKNYFKFKIAANGLYRIRQTTLSALGLGGTNADHYQLWRNGQQVPLYTSVQNTPLGASDYIEFWGMMNDGKPDLPLYREPDYQLCDKWSLQTDTAAYFLTVNTTSANARLETTTNNVAGNILSPEPFFIYTEGRYPNDKIHPGRAEIVGDSYTYSASYDNGEGWTAGDLGTGATYPAYINNNFVYTGPGAPVPLFKLNAAGNAVHPRNFRIKLQGDSVGGSPLNYYDCIKYVLPLTVAQINTGNLVFEITNQCTEPNDRVAIAKIELQYARQFNFGGATNYSFELPANAAGNYLEIAGFNHGGTAPVLYDLTNGKRYVGDISNPSLVKVALLPSAVDRKLMLVNETAGNIAYVSLVTPRNFVNYGLAANQGDYLIITSQVLAGPLAGLDPVEDYRVYRSSAPGGSYNAKVYVIDQLIDQFAFGIKMHPLSIRNFLRWARATYSAPLKDVLIIGKGVIYNQYRANEGYADINKLCLVPTFGYPASDHLLSAEGNSSVPLTPIGRVSAIERSEIKVYLDKVKSYEQLQASPVTPTIGDMAWRKNVVHVTGASDDVTTQILQTANEGFQRIIEDTLYGGKVYSFTKSTSESVQQLNGSKLASLFEEGLGLLTYFGHSSASTLEFNLDNPQNYNNPNKYPVMVVMGCNAGNFFNYNLARLSTKETISEKYVLAPERGSIAFLASTHLGIVHYLDIYNTRLYEAMSFRDYGKTLGEIMHEAIVRVFASTTENDFYARFQCEEFLLHGDPALHPYNFAKPDYVIEEPLVKVSPSFISVAETSFKVNAGFMNIGRAPDKKLVVELKRTFPDLTTSIRRDTVDATLFRDSIIYEVPIVATRDKGLNKLTITLDPDNAIDEAFETNNTISKDVYIFEDEVRPIYPYNLSIVNQQNPKLIVSTANAFAEMRSYVLQMDTTELFNSPLKLTTTTSSTGGVFEFGPGLAYTDSTVYYWRVAPVPPFGDTTWNVSSFIYINGGQNGFSQAHLYQHFKSIRERLNLDSTTRRWSFYDKSNFLFAQNGVYPFTSPDGAYYHGTINDVEGILNPGCSYNEMIMNVIDPVTMKVWKNTGMQYGSFGNCGARDYNFEFLLNDITWRNKAKDFIENVVPDGFYVLIRSNTNPNQAGNNYAPEWKADENINGAGISLYHTLSNQGWTGIDSFYIPRAYIILFKKNSPADFTTKWQVSDNIFQGITLTADFHAPDSSGYITSPLLGPSKGWHQLKWRGKSLDVDESTDSPRIDVIGVDNAGVETVIFPGVDRSQEDFDISSIPVAQYPYLKLRMKNVDSVYHTAYQLKYWMVTYDPVPEGAIAPNIYFTTKDTVEVGEPFNFGIAFKNVSNVSFDSVKVKITITDKNNVENIVPTPQGLPRLKDLMPGDTVKLNTMIQTGSLSGHNTLFVNFNPDFDQPEQYLTNNYAFRNLYVKPDSLNPLLDVTFDGQHILNRDIVSAKPAILIKLKDEAKWMALDDTSYLDVSVKFPDGTQRRIHFLNNTDTLEFVPAGQSPNPNNTATINFKPYFKQDGEYELIVVGRDRSNNAAGAIQYRVAFQIYNKPMISNMLNYPNPFTTSTAFVFTVTGTQVPQNIRIQILTITGKVVREITKDELGPLHVGRNITEYKWDGTDQYGSKLANGIYLYRVITNLNGKSLDKFKAESDLTDKYFNNGYGKMYLMR